MTNYHKAEIVLTANTQPVSYEIQYHLTRELHRRLQSNNFHDEQSLYSHAISRGKTNNEHLDFPLGAKFTFSFYDEKILNQLAISFLKDRKLLFGMTVKELRFVETPDFGSQARFFAASPILVKKFDGTTVKHLTYTDANARDVMTVTLQSKLKKANLSTDVSVKFDMGYAKAKTQLVNVNGIKNRTSLCPIIIEGDPVAIQFAWIVGIGHSTGCGFGAIA
jgi:CRISPR-associated endoribonuclease Cas6